MTCPDMRKGEVATNDPALRFHPHTSPRQADGVVGYRTGPLGPGELRDLRPFIPELDEHRDLGIATPEEVIECARARARGAAIAAWEDAPLDPRDDLSLIYEYPSEAARLRELQSRTAADPYYRVAELAGEALRRLFLVEATELSIGVVEKLAEEFHETHLCECPGLGSEFADGRYVARRHRDAARCRWCVLRDRLLEERHDALLTAAGISREVRGSSPQAVAHRLSEALRGGA